MNPKINIAEILAPINAIMVKATRGESITEEEKAQLTAGMPVKFAYDELMRQVRKYQEVIQME